MNNFVIRYMRRFTTQSRYAEGMLSTILLFLFIYSFGKGIIQAAGGVSLGVLFRIFLPSGFYFSLFVFFSLIDLKEIKSLLNLRDITFKQFVSIAAIALLLAYLIIIEGSNYGFTASIIGMIIMIGFFTSIYFIIVGNASTGVAIFLLTFPFLSYFEYYYSYRYAFFKGIEWGPIIVTPTITFLLLLFFASMIAKSREGMIREFKPMVVKAIFIFIFIVFIASLFSIRPILSTRYFILTWIYPLILFVIILRSIHTTNDIKVLAHSTIACICLISFFSLYFFLRRSEGMVELQNIYGSVLATHITSGTWGQMTAMSIPLSIVLFSLSKRRGKIAYLLVIAFLFLSLVLSFSRGAMAAIIIALAILLKKKELRKVVIAVVAILILTLVLHKSLLSNYILYRFKNIRSFNDLVYDSSVQARWEGAKAALGMVKDYPLFGIGTGMWKDYVSHYAKMQRVVIGTKWGGKYEYGLGYIEDAHSLQLQVAVDSGIPGFITWIFLLAMVFKEAFYVLYKSRDHFRCHLMFGAFSSLVFFVVMSIFGGFDLRLFLGTHFLFWIVVAIIVKLKYLELQSQGNNVAQR